MLRVWVTVATEYEILVGTLDTVPAKECTPLLRDVERYADVTRIYIFELAFSMASMRLSEITADRLAWTKAFRNKASDMINNAEAITTSSTVNASVLTFPLCSCWFMGFMIHPH